MTSIGRKIERFEVTVSTNSLLKARAELGLAEEGTVIWADHQTAGRGRLDRAWEADPGKGLLFSTLILPDSSLSRISLIGLLASLAVYDSLLEYFTATMHFDQNRCRFLRLKWPNDIIFDGRKLCGILCESGVNSSDKNRFIVVGIGVNVNQTLQDFSEELRSSATSLYLITQQTIDRQSLLHRILHHLDRYYHTLITHGDDWITADWLQCSSVLGKNVKISQRDQVIEGICRGLERDGAMNLELKSGETVIIYSGDTSNCLDEDY